LQSEKLISMKANTNNVFVVCLNNIKLNFYVFPLIVIFIHSKICDL
jgi:hypothetical protein